MAKGDWYFEIASGDCFEIREESGDRDMPDRVVALSYPEDWAQGVKDGYLLAAAPKLLELAKLSADIVDDSLEERPPRHSLGSLYARLKAVISEARPPESDGK